MTILVLSTMYHVMCKNKQLEIMHLSRCVLLHFSRFGLLDAESALVTILKNRKVCSFFSLDL